jgi:hypothetical protein
MKYCEVKVDETYFKSLVFKDNGAEVATFEILPGGGWGCILGAGFYTPHVLREILLYHEMLEGAEIP